MGRCSLSERHPMCRLVNEKYKYILINDRLPQSRRLRMSLGRSAVLTEPPTNLAEALFRDRGRHASRVAPSPARERNLGQRDVHRHIIPNSHPCRT